ncbi:hypothetical protein [Mesorhizobium sp.]|uniref:hypothetical protein n=1 Tax=Mesorhizobium sp. TaxID=1871066 RepID=UPI000FE657B0|nr:hypothetical protein [Mesorhizobium sp.]RWO22831.1 MAG: hypothetical protein EOS09_19375 [Mesorhizobium sp.]
MSDIPDDIRATAESLVDPVVCSCNYDRATAIIAEALMAERENCAKIAEGMPWQIDVSPDHVRGLKGSDVAAAIRSPDNAAGKQ